MSGGRRTGVDLSAPHVQMKYAEQYPTVDQRIMECSSVDILKRLDTGEADLVLTNLKPKQEGLAYQKLLRDPLVIAAPYSGDRRRRYPNSANNMNAPLAIDLSQLESETLIVLRSWQNMRVAAEITCRMPCSSRCSSRSERRSLPKTGRR